MDELDRQFIKMRRSFNLVFWCEASFCLLNVLLVPFEVYGGALLNLLLSLATIYATGKWAINISRDWQCALRAYHSIKKEVENYE